MTAAEIVAWAMFVVLIAWVGIVLIATLRQLDAEQREAARHDR